MTSELAAAGAVEQPAFLAQLAVLGVELDCRRVAHLSDSRKRAGHGLFRLVKLVFDDQNCQKRISTCRNTSEAIEDYAKAIYALSQVREGPVLNGEVAERLGVTPATATSMLKRLDGSAWSSTRPTGASP